MSKKTPIDARIYDYGAPSGAMYCGELFDEEAEIQNRYRWSFTIFSRKIILACNEGEYVVKIKSNTKEQIENGFKEFFRPSKCSFSWNYF